MAKCCACSLCTKRAILCPDTGKLLGHGWACGRDGRPLNTRARLRDKCFFAPESASPTQTRVSGAVSGADGGVWGFSG